MVPETCQVIAGAWYEYCCFFPLLAIAQRRGDEMSTANHSVNAAVKNNIPLQHAGIDAVMCVNKR
jgi:hypothetical protein